MTRVRTQLDIIGMDMAKKDFRYWEAMQIKYGGYEKMGSKGSKLEINMNIPRPKDKAEVIELKGEENE